MPAQQYVSVRLDGHREDRPVGPFSGVEVAIQFTVEMQPGETVAGVAGDLRELTANDHLAIREGSQIEHRTVYRNGCTAPRFVQCAIRIHPGDIGEFLATERGKFTTDNDPAVFLQSNRMNHGVGSGTGLKCRIHGTISVQTAHPGSHYAPECAEFAHGNNLPIRLNVEIAHGTVGTTLNSECFIECPVGIQTGDVANRLAGNLREFPADHNRSIGLHRNSKHLAIDALVDREGIIEHTVRI